MRGLSLLDLIIIAAVVVVIGVVAARDSQRYVGRAVSAPPTPASAGAS